MEANYLPSKADYNNLVSWLNSQKLPITLIDQNHTTIYLRASVAEVSTVFGATFARVGKNGEEYTSAITAPSLPSDLADRVLSIAGLQPHRRLKRPRLTRLAPQLYFGGAYGEYLTPVDIQGVYNFPTNLTGSGQTIAIYEESPPQSTSEFSSFWSLIGSSQSLGNVTVINPEQLPVNPGEYETALDVEWAGALAPGAAIRIYVDNNFQEALGTVLNDAASIPGLSVLSISYGSPESEFYDPSYSQTFAQLAAAGVSVVVAAGDYVPNLDPPGVNYPASDPNVTAVGGTDLDVNGVGIENYEIGFYFSGVLPGGYYGTMENQPGASSVFSIPAWQASTIAAYNANNPTAALGDGQHRVVPDVSAFALAAVNNTQLIAALVYDDNTAVNHLDSVFGTSASAPIWAGAAALINQERARIGQPQIGLLNPALYSDFYLNSYNLPPPLSILGSNTERSYQYQSGTGLGSPDVSEIVLCLGDGFYAYAEQWLAAVSVGGTVTLNAEASSPNASFQWQVNSGSGWVNLTDGVNSGLFSSYSGSASPDLTISALNGYPGQFQYRALATSAEGATAATGPVNVDLGQPLGSIVKGLPSGPVQTGTSISLSSANSEFVVNHTEVAYQWELNGVPIAGAQSSYYSFTVTPGSQGYYSLVISNPYDPLQFTTVNFGYLAVDLPSQIYHTQLLAGGPAGFQDGTGGAAKFNAPSGLAVDGSGNVFVADTGNNAIRMISPSGVTTTVAGQASAGKLDGTGSSAEFNGPQGVAADSSGNLFVADTYNYAIRMITAGGVVTTLASGVQRLNLPAGVAVAGSGNIFVADSDGSEIRTVTRAGSVSNLAPFEYPTGIAEDQDGNLFIVNYQGNVSEIVAGSSEVSTLALTLSPGSILHSVAVDGQENLYLVDDVGLWISPVSGPASYVYTDSGSAILTQAETIIGSATCDAAGNIYYLTSVRGNPIQYSVNVATPVASVSKPAPATAVTPGVPVEMSATASNFDGTPSYQWQFNGVNIPGATQATLTIQDPGPADRGSYSVVITNSKGSSTLGAGTLNVGSSDSWLANLSARAYVESGSNVLISGFEIASGTGSTNKNVLVTGKGPVLAPAGISNYLPNPVVDLYDSQSKLIATNTGWSTAPIAAAGTSASALASQVSVNPVSAKLITNASGSAPATGSADSMLVSALPAGGYTSVISDANGKDGVAIAEVYDVDSLLGNSGNTARLSNLSARSFVGTGNEVLIAGFVIDGGPSGEPETVMIRGQGPNLASYVQGALTQTKITLYQNLSTGSYPIASNSGWGSTPTYASGSGISSLATTGVGLESAPTALQLQYAGNALQTGSSDSAMVVTLPPGAYTVILDPAGGLPGVGLVEVFELR